MENIDWQKSGDAIDESESAEIYEQNMMQMGKAARTIAGKLKYGPMMSESYGPGLVMFEASATDYLGRDRSREVFENKGITDAIKATYADVIEEHPELKCVEIVSEPGHYGGDMKTWASSGDSAAHIVVTGDFSEGSSENKISESEYYACKMMAIQLAIEYGCSSADVMLNADLQRDMILLHELGHANNFINNYLKPIYRKIAREGVRVDFAGFEFEDEKFTDAISEAIEEYGLRTETLTKTKYLSPTSLASTEDAVKAGLCKAGEEDAYIVNAWQRLKLRFYAGGVADEDERVVEDARRYRMMDEEHSADQFALDYIMAHRDKYFLRPGEEPDGSGRIPTSEGEVDVTGVFCPVFNCVPGNEVMLKSEDDDVSRGRFVEMPIEGEELLLTSSDDPDDESSYESFGKVEEVVCKTIEDEQGKRHRQTVVYTDKGGYLMSTAREVHRPIMRTPEEMAEALNVRKGQELQMMSLLASTDEEAYKDDSGEYAPAFGSGSVLYGRVEEDIKIGEPITIMAQQDLEHLSEWKSWPVESIEQDWRTWRINTRVGNKRATYEVMPLPIE